MQTIFAKINKIKTLTFRSILKIKEYAFEFIVRNWGLLITFFARAGRDLERSEKRSGLSGDEDRRASKSAFERRDTAIVAVDLQPLRRI